jgi:hypothetical protein
VLRRRDLGQPGFLSPSLNPQECDERAHLLLHRLEPGQCVELCEQLLEWPDRLLPPEHVEIELFTDLVAELLAERLQPLKGIRGHGRTLPVHSYT